ncbi:hypothetical protein [Methylobacterium gnaphalii]|uniref:Uncharacterized protein n=1 Tax=Methylobacterium gnaphalii TaxID=1010610 RepID=A0A512JIV0_9HYPH|nr:hypothetical protein [Methylobacterium gnaphalii]GEP09853.1 hypothetical protein MGN01_16980 [Methylobacterium gnaphalii]GJD67232.1 hypothetical protein MMMDOFMJ_0146 [Methylobacterium gnaphalii]GLS49882.1 hypothetical protein GCM10007885_27340 [Methylobacterium gnaphalii]
MGLDALNPLAAIGRWTAHYSSCLLHDALSGVRTAFHGVEGRVLDALKGAESRLVDAAAAREERILGELNALRGELKELRDRFGFVGDPVATAPAPASASERLVPRTSSSGDTRLPPGRNHPGGP